MTPILKPVTDAEITDSRGYAVIRQFDRDYANHFKREGAKEILSIWEDYNTMPIIDFEEKYPEISSTMYIVSQLRKALGL